MKEENFSIEAIQNIDSMVTFNEREEGTRILNEEIRKTEKEIQDMEENIR